ncbi:concanavalin A-like lectin/glucanase domain-containing protein [Suillus ampliporus]|nr:concanavalin A-like lectin/glucanase domain-containing protein [Suillus ampliporus]
MKHWLALEIFASYISSVKGYSLVREYSGQSFFDRWDFYGGYDNLTQGNAIWVNESYATSQGLAYVDSQGHAIIKVDNITNVPLGQNRSTVRITTQDIYDLGSLWIIDLNHLPYGCSVWPAFWSFGPNWPENGEIDIIEGINVMSDNQMAIHTTPGCTHNGSEYQLGASGSTTNCSQPAGCTVTETSPNSYESGFAEAGGGVWATQFDASGIFIWFWSRPDVPTSINQADSASMDITQWGIPHASYFSSTCNISQYFSAQNLVLDITLCGDWAGVGDAYNASCGNSGPTGLCYQDCVVGPGSPQYDNAYFNVSSIRAYTSALPSATPTTSSTSTTATTSSTTTTALHTPSLGHGGSIGQFTDSSDNNGWGAVVMLLIAAPIAVIGSWPLMFKKRHQGVQPQPPA